MLDTLPLYFAFLGTGVGLIALALLVYVLITPHREITLIRQGNSAASLSLGGTVIGLAIALYSTASGSHTVLELAIWGAIGLISQIVVFVLISLALPGFRHGIEQDKVGYGITMAAFSIAMGILNAGSLSA